VSRGTHVFPCPVPNRADHATGPACVTSPLSVPVADTVIACGWIGSTRRRRKTKNPSVACLGKPRVRASVAVAVVVPAAAAALFTPFRRRGERAGMAQDSILRSWGGLGRAENDRPASPVMRCPTVWFSPSQLCPSHFVWFPVYSIGRPDGGLLPKLHLARFLRILGTDYAVDITFYVVREKKNVLRGQLTN
jgi:hypothetical protein